MTIFKPNFVKSISKRMLVLAVLASMVLSLGIVQTVKAQEDQAGLFSAIKDFFTFGDTIFPVSEEREPSRTIWVTVTAYSSTVDQCDSTPCITANGFDLCQAFAEHEVADTIAANFLKFGTQVRLPEISGNKILVVRDRMNARYNGQNRIDVWMPTREMAQKFGVKRVKMEIF